MKSFIRHRVNRRAELELVDPTWGVEIDLRSVVDAPAQLHLAHEPWSRGEDFEAWLDGFVERGIRGPIILNTKEDGLEARVRDLLAARDLSNFFFLDTTVPTLVRWTAQQERRFALRYSVYEPTVSPFSNRCDWLWVDCFSGQPVDARALEDIRGSLHICLVSPELQGVPLSQAIDGFGELYRLADAVCTKDPRAWVERFGS